MIQLTLTLKVTTAQVVETSVTVNNNSAIQDYVHPDVQTKPTFDNITWLVKLSDCTYSTGTRRLEVTFLDNETSLPAFVGSELLISV